MVVGTTLGKQATIQQYNIHDTQKKHNEVGEAGSNSFCNYNLLNGLIISDYEISLLSDVVLLVAIILYYFVFMRT
jgi:hypothetical protein